MCQQKGVNYLLSVLLPVLGAGLKIVSLFLDFILIKQEDAAFSPVIIEYSAVTRLTLISSAAVPFSMPFMKNKILVFYH